jgi:hypothetical protein
MVWVQNLEYVVERDETHWTVSLQCEHCGRFGTRRAAMESAMRDAERVRRLGHEVSILVRYEDGRLRRLPGSLRLAGQRDGTRPPGCVGHRR